MPTLEDLERQVRRRAVGRTIVEICSDLAVVPGFCTPAFWNGMFEVMHYFGGSVATVMREKTRREQAFIQEQDSKLDSTWDWMQLKRDEIRQISASSSANHRSIHSRPRPRHWPPAHPDPSQSGVSLPPGPDNGRPRRRDSPHDLNSSPAKRGGREGVKLPVGAPFAAMHQSRAATPRLRIVPTAEARQCRHT